jgi:serine/threonine-protein kinase
MPTAPTPAAKGRSKAPLAVGAGLLVGALVVGGFFLMRGGKGGNGGGTTSPGTTVLPTAAPGTTAPVTDPGSTSVPGSTDVTTTSVAGPPLRGSDGAVDRLAFGNPPGGVPGPVLQAGVSGVVAVAFDTSGIGYVAVDDGTVLRIAGQQVELFAQLPESAGVAGGIAVADDGTVFITAEDGLWTFGEATSTLVVPLAAAGLGAQPGPVAIDPLGNAYFADNANHRIIRRGVDGALSLVAGNGIAAVPGPVDGDGQAAQNVPIGLVTAMVIDRNGRLVFNDGVLLAVRSITPDGIINTVAGGGAQPLVTGPGTWADDGTPARSLAFGGVDGLAVDGNGALYVADDPSGAIIRIDGSGNLSAVIVRNPAVQPVDGVAAQQSSVGQLGAMSCNPSGGLVFTDGTALRLIAEP